MVDSHYDQGTLALDAKKSFSPLEQLVEDDHDDSSSYYGNNRDDYHHQMTINDEKKNNRVNHSKSISEELGKSDTIRIVFLRTFFFMVLVLSALGSMRIAHWYIDNNQKADFEEETLKRGRRVLELIKENFQRKLSASDTLSFEITSYAESTKSPFPFVTLPHFAIQGSANRILSDGIQVSWLPLVNKKRRLFWEKYSDLQKKWIDVALEEEITLRMRQDEIIGLHNHFDNVDRSEKYIPPKQLGLSHASYNSEEQQKTGMATSEEFCDQIYGLDENGNRQIEPADSEGPFFPFWQMSPVLPATYYLNYNMMNDTKLSAVLKEALKSEKAVLNKATVQPKSEEVELISDETREVHDSIDPGILLSQEFLRAGQFRYDTKMKENSVSTDLIYPVFDGFESDKELAGFIHTTIHFDSLLVDVHSENTHGVVLVIENTQDQVFTFLVVGNMTQLVGLGDLHDPEFTYLETKGELTASFSSETASYTRVDLDSDICHYTIKVYPSHLCGPYHTKKPMQYAMVVGAIFGFSCLIFFIYDLLVQRRQTTVVKSALKNHSIVSSLFPANVRDRLFEQQECTENGELSMSKTTPEDEDFLTPATATPFGGVATPDMKSVAAGMMRQVLKGRSIRIQNAKAIRMSNKAAYNKAMNNSNHWLSKPIADHFQNTTILFADIAGFTSWSDSRDPVQVFQLLESFYSAFDEIALRHHVFKVETIGDCYVAVTGVPDPQKDHALIMAIFANEIMIKMNEIVKMDLMDSPLAGDDTLNLMMRVGLHSGPVTAGVLRGQKSRFQLFGDSMNTASRMESNGIKGRIHVSMATADELIAAGKSQWITPREDTISVKGKGKMQTYWVNVNESESTFAMSSPFDETTKASF